MTPVPVFAKDFTFSAQLTASAYAASHSSPGARGGGVEDRCAVLEAACRPDLFRRGTDGNCRRGRLYAS
jgi:hypothetical protein